MKIDSRLHSLREGIVVAAAFLGKGHVRGDDRRCWECIYGRRSRNNCEVFVAGMVTDLVVPLSIMLAVFGNQVDGEARAPACSKTKSLVSTDGQETIASVPERITESVGSAGR